MKRWIAILMIGFASTSAFAQTEEILAEVLPSCEVSSFNAVCDSGGGYGTVEVPGCKVTCPENKVPICKAGARGSYCSSTITAPTCTCQ